MRACLIGLLVLCSCSKETTPGEQEIAERPTAPPHAGEAKPTKDASALEKARADGILGLLNGDGGAFASITGTRDFSSSGGVYLGTVETPDPLDAKNLKSVMGRAADSLKRCLYYGDLVQYWPLEAQFQLDASGRASSLVLAKGQQIPCLTDWLEGLELGPPKGGKAIKVNFVMELARE